MCVYVLLWLCLCLYIFTYIYVLIYIYIYRNNTSTVHVCIYICIHIHTYTQILKSAPYRQVQVCLCQNLTCLSHVRRAKRGNKSWPCVLVKKNVFSDLLTQRYRVVNMRRHWIITRSVCLSALLPTAILTLPHSLKLVRLPP